MSEEQKFKEIGVQDPGDNGEFRFVAIRNTNMVDTDEHGISDLIQGFEVVLTADVVENIVEIMDRIGDMIDDDLVGDSDTRLVMRKGIVMDPLTIKQAAYYSKEASDEAEYAQETPEDYEDCWNMPGHVELNYPEAHISADGVKFVSKSEHDAHLEFQTTEIDTRDIRLHLEKIDGPRP